MGDTLLLANIVLAEPLTVVIDGISHNGPDGSGVLARLVLQENLDAEANYVQVVLLCLQQLLTRYWGHTFTDVSDKVLRYEIFI